MKTLYIFRGASGSGKSTSAKKVTENVAEADMFMYVNGEYKFHPSKLKHAHESCQNMVHGWMEEGKETIAICNTSTRLWEFEKYLTMAKEHDYTVKVYRCMGYFDNVHGVPYDYVCTQRERMEPFEGEEFIYF